MEFATYGLAAITGVLSFFIVRRIKEKRLSILIEEKEKKANDILEKAHHTAEDIKRQKISKAKEKFSQLKKEYEISFQKKKSLITEKEKSLNKNYEDLKRQRKNLLNDIETHKEKRVRFNAELEKLKEDRYYYAQKLESIANITKEKALEELKKNLLEEASAQIQPKIQKEIAEAELTADTEARKIILTSIQRIAVEHAAENTVSSVSIESDEIKGRIIGKEGRNIRSFEAVTGVDITVNDTTEVVSISSFDPVRREIAKLSLEKLIKDGRIHPARVEEVVTKTTEEIDNHIIETGKKTVLELGIHGLHPELIKKVGRMKYRYSYGQNLLAHSKEVANMAAVMAAELKVDPKLAKRAGLLHDIGKVAQDQPEKPHALLGMDWAEKFGEQAEICNAIGAHHDEIEKTSSISFIVQICDSISGSRPGVRKQNADAYFEKLKDLEEVATRKEGVKKSFAIQAGRELRVMVESDKISDEKAKSLSYEISKEIEAKLKYPGQIKVVVIRETRSVSTAR